MDSTLTHATTVTHDATVRPMLRTVLLCDIVESTALVERLGDGPTVALMQKHDAMLRQALAFCHGQLIDKADGVLALFERPIQALDFALRYQRGLRDLARDEGIELKARIGIHVGDVMTWANAPKDVLAGAKAIEVEGLAKPVAARLMGLALPGQILMSGMAQNLAHRAAGELGDVAPNLRWLLHGRYRFKGVPAPMLVHEVGEAGVAPLRPPESGGKAWREVPLWRRPPVLALELLVLGVFATMLAWSTFRSPPAIAFAERDWVVVADLQNRTEEVLFDDSLDAALRVGLEQSRHVNMVPDLQIDRALARMQREGQPVDRQLASELALREGARAVILPTVAQVGGVVRISLEVIDPNSGVTVYSESADGLGDAAALSALDDALVAVRARLGEAMGNIEANHLPLEQVTTSDLEALRAFSLGLQARNAGRSADAMALYRQAVERDPEFSMAWLRMGAVELGNDLDEAKRHFERAAATRGRLTRRENLVLDASLALLGPPGPMLEKWKVFASLYPDEYRAFYNYSYFAHFAAQRYRDAADFIRPALVQQNPGRASAHYLLAANLLADDRIDDAIVNFKQAESLGLGAAQREYADAHAARRDYPAAAQVLARMPRDEFPGTVLQNHLAGASHPLDRGQWPQAIAALDALSPAVAKAPADVVQTHRLMQLSLASYAPGGSHRADVRAYLAGLEPHLAGAHALDRPHWQFRVLATGWLAAHAGDPDTARRALSLAGDDALASGFPWSADMARLVQAELDLADGNAEAAIERLAPRATGGDELYFLHAVLMRAHAAAGDHRRALEQAEWLAAHRGRAFGEPNSQYAWTLANVVESNLATRQAALFAERLGDDDAAQALRLQFEKTWPQGEGSEAVTRRLLSLD